MVRSTPSLGGMYLRIHFTHQTWESQRGRNISIISAISLEKVVASVNIYGAVDAVTFEGFILKEVLPKIKEGDCLIMDNAKIHLGEMVREIIEQEKARLIYLPPYSPEFSPIENFC